MNKLTTIIPFLNEGEEIARTVASIRETAGNEVDILLVNDNTQDHIDYRKVANKYNCHYHYNSQRQGVARSRDIGVELCKTDYFILFDGHMRFYHNNWWNEVVNALQNDDRAVYCLRSYPLNEEFILVEESGSYGACLNVLDTNFDNVLGPKWINEDIFPDEKIVQIPCVLGACYGVSKRYWNKIKGLNGLITYGSDEALLSLKTWMEGGRCLLFKEIQTGHIYRKKHPYKVATTDILYNKLLIAELLLPVSYKTQAFQALNSVYPNGMNACMKLLQENRQLIADQKKYLASIFTQDIDSFIDFNNKMQKQLSL